MESTQAIDSEHGRSARYGVGRSLDDWLMVDASIEKWESEMTPGGRRVLTNCLVAVANDKAEKNDKFRISCFTYTAILMC